MGALRRSPIWSDPRVKPPYGSVEIDWRHPLALGLHDCVLWNEGAGGFINLGPGGAPGTLTAFGGTFPTWIPTPGGAVLKEDNNQSGAVLPSHGGFVGQTPSAVRIRLIPNAYTSTYNMLAEKGTNSAGDKEFGIYVNAVGSTFSYLYFGGTTEAALSAGVVSLSVVHDVVCSRDSGNLVSIYVDGVLATSVSLSGTTVSTADWRFGRSLMGGNNSNEMTHLTLQSWRRTLLASDTQWLNAEPYVFLRPIIRRRYFVPQIVGIYSQRQILIGVGA